MYISLLNYLSMKSNTILYRRIEICVGLVVPTTSKTPEYSPEVHLLNLTAKVIRKRNFRLWNSTICSLALLYIVSVTLIKNWKYFLAVCMIDHHDINVLNGDRHLQSNIIHTYVLEFPTIQHNLLMLSFWKQLFFWINKVKYNKVQCHGY